MKWRFVGFIRALLLLYFCDFHYAAACRCAGKGRNAHIHQVFARIGFSVARHPGLRTRHQVNFFQLINARRLSGLANATVAGFHRNADEYRTQRERLCLYRERNTSRQHALLRKARRDDIGRRPI